MAVNKQQCIDFLQAKNREEIEKVQLHYGKLIEIAKQQSLSRYEGRLNKIQNELNQLSTRIDDLMADMSIDQETLFVAGDYYRKQARLGNWTGTNWKNELESHCKYMGQVEKLRNERRSKSQEINAEFDKVHAMITPIRSASKIIELLDEIGFDTKPLKVINENKSIVPQININLLGVK